MKRVLLTTTILLLVLAFAAFAAEPAPEAGKGLTGFGFKVGAALANATGADATPPAGVDKKMKIGFGVGAFLTYSFTPMLAIQPEILYIMKGVKYEQGSAKETLKLDYLQVPVYFKVSPETQGKIKPTFFAGPFLGILMSAKDKTEGFADPAENGEVDVKDNMKSTEFGLSFGLGAAYQLTKGAITIDGRYDLGLSKIPKEVGGIQPNIKSGTISFLLGYSFR